MGAPHYFGRGLTMATLQSSSHLLPAIFQADAEDVGQRTQSPPQPCCPDCMPSLGAKVVMACPTEGKDRWAQSTERNRRGVYDSSVPLTTICLMERE